MDEEEAKQMIKGLQKVAEDAEHQKFKMSMHAQQVRKTCAKKAALAIAPLPEPDAMPSSANKHAEKAHGKPKKKVADKLRSKLFTPPEDISPCVV